MRELVLNAPDLITLELIGCYTLTDAGAAHIHGFRSLKKLSLSPPDNLTSSAKCDLGRIRSLQELSFDEDLLSHDLLQSMANLKDLRVLGEFSDVDSRGFDIICTSFERLESLEISFSLFSDVDGKKLCRFKNLKNLRLDDSEDLTDVTFTEGIRHCSLQKLSISHCVRLTGLGISCINTSRGPLRELSLNNSGEIRDSDLEDILRRGNFLRSVHVSNCRSLSDTWVEVFQSCCPRLERLELAVSALKKSSLRKLSSRRPTVALYSF